MLGSREKAKRGQASIAVSLFLTRPAFLVFPLPSSIGVSSSCFAYTLSSSVRLDFSRFHLRQETNNNNYTARTQKLQNMAKLQEKPTMLSPSLTGVYIPAAMLVIGTAIVKMEYIWYSVSLAVVLAGFRMFRGRRLQYSRHKCEFISCIYLLTL